MLDVEEADIVGVGACAVVHRSWRARLAVDVYVGIKQSGEDGGDVGRARGGRGAAGRLEDRRSESEERGGGEDVRAAGGGVLGKLHGGGGSYLEQIRRGGKVCLAAPQVATFVFGARNVFVVTRSSGAGVFARLLGARFRGVKAVASLGLTGWVCEEVRWLVWVRRR